MGAAVAVVGAEVAVNILLTPAPDTPAVGVSDAEGAIPQVHLDVPVRDRRRASFL